VKKAGRGMRIRRIYKRDEKEIWGKREKELRFKADRRKR
jgi:hypothetical protein